MAKEEPAGLASRRAALRLLDAVMRTGATSDQASHSATKGLPPADRALALAITGEVLRWMVDLDHLIDSKTSMLLPDDAKARMVLRMALAQMLRLGTPPHAAISTALPLVEKGPRRLVHGVLGGLYRDQATLPETPSLNHEVTQRWQRDWGAEMVGGSALAIAEPPPLDLTLKDASETEKWCNELGGNSLAAGHVRLARGTAVETLPGFRDGSWWVQDLGASLPVRVLGEGTDRSVLDLCAAPGGKTMQLAAHGWKVTALDNSARRMERLSTNLARTKLEAELLRADLLKWEPTELFDAVLLDAPCSATGTMRRHPDVLHRIGERQIDELVELQMAMLDRAAECVKPGGTFVYATCSLEKSEGEDQVRAFLLRNPAFEIALVPQASLPSGISPDESGFVRTFPAMLADAGGVDGFFVAAMQRKC